MAHIFISYSKKDRDFADILMREIRDQKFPTWIDSEQIRVGKDWQQEIDKAIKQSSALVLIMTPSAKEAEYVTYEWSFALGSGVTVVTVIREKTELHSRLQSIQYFDFTERERPFSKLTEVLKEIQAEFESSRKLLSEGDFFSTDSPDWQKIRTLLAALYSEEDYERNAASLELAQMGAVAIPVLVNSLSSPSSSVRQSAAQALGWMKNNDTVGELEDRLYVEYDGNVQHDLVRALKRIGTEDALSAINIWENPRDEEEGRSNVDDIPF